MLSTLVKRPWQSIQCTKCRYIVHTLQSTWTSNKCTEHVANVDHSVCVWKTLSIICCGHCSNYVSNCQFMKCMLNVCIFLCLNFVCLFGFHANKVNKSYIYARARTYVYMNGIYVCQYTTILGTLDTLVAVRSPRIWKRELYTQVLTHSSMFLAKNSSIYLLVVANTSVPLWFWVLLNLSMFEFVQFIEI